MGDLEHMARTRTGGKIGPLTTVGWMTGLSLVVFGGIALASSFLVPGVALAGTLPSDATGAHPWIVDGGGEVAGNMSWRVEITIEYIAMGIAAFLLALRFGKILLAKLQDWCEGMPLAPAKPLAQPVPAVAMPRPGHGRDRAAPANDRHKLHAA
jgi:hypothetical protein